MNYVRGYMQIDIDFVLNILYTDREKAIREFIKHIRT